MKKFLFAIGIAILSLLGAIHFSTQPTWADASGDFTSQIQQDPSTSCTFETFLFMRPWYYGLKMSSDCKNIDSENFKTDGTGSDSDQLYKSILTIVLNIIYDITVVIGVLAAGFLIYGGYQYIYSGGDSAKAARGRKTITAAIIGMIISLLGNIIINTIAKIIFADASKNSIYNIYEVNPEDIIGKAINFILGLAVMVAVGFIIYSGVSMMTSYGDPAKTAKSKKGIIYSVAGLLISMLAFAIVNFVLGGLSTAGASSASSDIFDVINNVFGIVLGISGFIATVGAIIGGITYITSSGDATKTQKAKHTLTYSIVGLVIVLVAGAVVSFVIKQAFGT